LYKTAIFSTKLVYWTGSVMTGFAGQLIDTLQTFPKELWTPIGMLAAGLLSAGIAFIGVVLQNWAAARRHRRELV
jgi:hypothetical protein